MANAAASLSQLVEVASGDLTGPDAEDALTEALEAAQNLRATLGWAALDGEEISALALTRALGDILKNKEGGLQGRAAAVYAALLSIKDAPVGTLCEPYAFTAFTNCLRNMCLPSKREGAAEGGPQQPEAAAGDHAAVSPVAVLDDVAAFLKHHSLKSSPEMFRLLLDNLVDISGSALASGKPEKGNKRGGGAARHQGLSVAEAAFALLPMAMDARHGNLLLNASVLCHRLTPVLLGLDSAKRSGHSWDRRGAALNLINSFLSEHEAARPCRMAIMRRVCVRTPDKAECRQLAVNAVQALIPNCTSEDVRAFCLFLYRLSRCPKTGSRVLAVELAGALLSTMASPFTASGAYKILVDGSAGAGDDVDAPWSAVCLAIVISRSNDKSASVRGKAISVLADCVQGLAKRLLDGSGRGEDASDMAAFLPALCAARHIKVQVTSAGRTAAGGADGDSDGEDDASPQDDPPEGAWTPPPEAKVTAIIPAKVSLDLSWMRTLCHARCRDEKAAVRKVALQLLESVLELSAAAARRRPGPSTRSAGDGPNAEDLVVLEEATGDSLVSVRKSALQVVCNLVVCYPHHAELACMWARSILPLIRDPESSIQEAVQDRLLTLLLEPLIVLGGKPRGGAGRDGGAAATAAQQQASEEVSQRLAALAQLGRAASGCLGRALAALSAKKLLRSSQTAAGLEAFLSADRLPAAAEEREADKAAGRRRQETEKERQQRRAVRDQREGAWMVFVEVAAQDPAAPSWQFLHQRWEELQTAGADLDASAQEGAMLLWVISHAASRFPADDAANLASGLLKAILGFNLPCAAVAAHLAALHKLTQSDGGQAVVGTPATWCVQVQEACENVLGKAMEARGNMSDALGTHCQLALFTLGEVVLLREAAMPGGAAVKVQALTYNRQVATCGPSSAGSCQAAVCAHAWTCLGKLCMVDEGLAKKCVPLMVQEMSGSPSPVVRANLLVGLADMIVQFTGLADAYVGKLAAMVRDPHELVRRQALALLANLLLRDFVKWRGALVHRFLLALVDESPSVRQLAQYLLSDSLASKAPMLAYNHFIESLFVLNDCSAGLHGSRTGGGGASELAAELAVHSALEGGNGFHLKGSAPIMRAKRDIIYTALLHRMSPEHRFAAFAKLVAEVLGGVVDGLLPLSEADEVLGDALRLMACKDMKVNVNRFGASAEEDGTVEQLTGTQEDATKARGKLVGAMMRKHLAESVVPLMVELRYMLQAQKHPLLGSLMLCMASLLRDFKSEVDEILVSDKQLALEIMHDLKHYESLAKQQQQQQEAAMAAALAPKPAAGPPRNLGGPTQSKAPTTVQAMMPPPPTPGAGQRRQTVVLPGVEPRRTPLAAEILASASKRGGGATECAEQRTPGLARGLSTAAQTPAAGLQGAATAMRTPRTAIPGTAQRGLPGGLSVMLSPAPLSTRARVLHQQRAAGGALAAPAAAVAGVLRARHPGAPGGAADPAERIDVVLPSPMAGAQQHPGVRPLGSHNHNSDAAATGQKDVGKAQQRTPPAMLAAAVRAARQAAEAAVDNGVGDGGPQGASRAGPMDVVDAVVAKVTGEGDIPVRVKQEPAAAAGVGIAGPIKNEAPEVKTDVENGARAGRGRAGKRRHGIA